jgi:hypothetical protein
MDRRRRLASENTIRTIWPMTATEDYWRSGHDTGLPSEKRILILSSEKSAKIVAASVSNR